MINPANPGDAPVRIVVTAAVPITVTATTVIATVTNFEVSAAATVDPDVISFVAPGSSLDARGSAPLTDEANTAAGVNRTSLPTSILRAAIDRLRRNSYRTCQ